MNSESPKCFTDNQLLQQEIEAKEKQIVELCDGLRNTLLLKSKGYRNSVLKAPILAPHLPPGVGIDVRMSDKIERIISLTATPNAAAQKMESLLDTYIDLAGYCILKVIQLRMEQPDEQHL